MESALVASPRCDNQPTVGPEGVGDLSVQGADDEPEVRYEDGGEDRCSRHGAPAGGHIGPGDWHDLIDVMRL